MNVKELITHFYLRDEIIFKETTDLLNLMEKKFSQSLYANINLPDSYLISIWGKLSVAEKVKVLEYQRGEPLIGFILKSEKQYKVLKKVLSSYILSDEKLAAFYERSLIKLDKVILYLPYPSKEMRELYISRDNGLESILWKCKNFGNFSFEEVFSSFEILEKAKPSKINNQIAAYLIYIAHKNQYDLTKLESNQAYLSAIISSSYLNSSKSLDLIKKLYGGYDQIRFTLMAGLANPLTDSFSVEYISNKATVNYDSELLGNVQSALAKKLHGKTYLDALEESQLKTLIQRIAPSNFRVEGRLVDALHLSENKFLDDATKAKLHSIINECKSRFLLTENLEMENPQKLPQYDIDGDSKKIEGKKLHQLSIYQNKEVTNFLVSELGYDIKTWETLFSLWEGFEGTLAELTLLVKAI